MPPASAPRALTIAFLPGPSAALTNGNNLFGLNFFDIGNNNLFTANNIGTGLQGIIAGERQHVGRQSGDRADELRHQLRVDG